MSTEGIIYLLQPKELIESHGYKIGYTHSDDFRRFNGYNSGAKLIYAIRCENVRELETKLKQILPTKFKLLSGREYFRCLNDSLSEMFFDIATKHNKSMKQNAKKTTSNKPINYHSNQPVSTFLNKNTLIQRNDTPNINSSITIDNLFINNPLLSKLVNNNQNTSENTSDNINEKNISNINNIYNTDNLLNTTDIVYSEEKKETPYKCKICNISLCSLTSFRNHCSSKQHISVLHTIESKNLKSNLPSKLNIATYKCIVCNITVKSMSSYRYHCTSKQHLQTVNALCMQQNTTTNTQVTTQLTNVEEFKCDICDKSFCNKGNVTRHKKQCKPK